MAESWKLPRNALQRIGLTGGIVALNLALICTIGVTRPEEASSTTAAPSPRAESSKPRPYAEAPPQGPAAPVDDPTASDKAQLHSWSGRIAGKTGIAAHAVTAYGRAEMWMRSKSADCHISWLTLAAIGRVAAGHGGGSAPGAGETVGPLRIPAGTWQRWAARASGDGAAPTPDDRGDAALTAARALCGRQVDMRTSRGWWTAMVDYKQSVSYAQRVFTAAEQIARAAS